ncbi:alpha/beta hydrolase [Longimicrobium terrae]|uniref:Acetyl esterase/lipase n=1 Tax=Longimicrobium terrae TaxID=1639882 RepID=A0A841GUF0_9BACT|nr:alpha/beta hydrolase [Longimicrobium terrae]MBB4634122.1 acetyl esterase/lipase [Longimicrobium terrae]MBB6068988.1 acetyl esterase/lipase [Longimicrobium terrae]NNC28166.1 alpha/beta hydrolase [Longimicrobium terrae]
MRIFKGRLRSISAAARAMGVGAMLLGAAGCSVRGMAEAVFVGDHFTRTADVAYGADPRLKLDVYRPKRVRPGAPVVVWLYGGRWQEGSKRDYRLLADGMTRRGWIVIVPDYRLYPSVTFPAWIQDGAQSVRWARDHARELGADPANLFVMGHSAGAHTVALLALDEHWLRDAGLPANAVRGFVALAGPVATTWTDVDVQALMGPREGWPATYPLTLIDGTEPPLLLLHGTGDRTVSVENSRRLQAAIRERGGCARAITYRGVGHVEIAVALSVPRLNSAPVLGDIARFVRNPRGACTADGGNGMTVINNTREDG